MAKKVASKQETTDLLDDSMNVDIFELVQ